ncbi:MAG: gluconate 2-dehydrogenase gamma chain [Gammaproteobacteria bacterium]|nr:gluconate 2-dehydrogenase gamma chain [Gammaproteobacteria bacterium]
MTLTRRETLKRIAWLMGGTVSASAILAIQKGYSATTPAGRKRSILTSSQISIVSVLADIMIPRTDTPGAIDVGVPGFIDLMLAEVYAQTDREHYLAGLADFDTAAQTEQGKKFLALEPAQQLALVRKFHDAAVIEDQRAARLRDDLQRPFILMTKELTLLGFFTSEAGATQVLQYVAVPGSYHACLPVEQAGNGKTWAVEPGIRF